jgi:hypothetical protein
MRLFGIEASQCPGSDSKNPPDDIYFIRLDPVDIEKLKKPRFEKLLQVEVETDYCRVKVLPLFKNLMAALTWRSRSQTITRETDQTPLITCFKSIGNDDSDSRRYQHDEQPGLVKLVSSGHVDTSSASTLCLRLSFKLVIKIGRKNVPHPESLGRVSLFIHSKMTQQQMHDLITEETKKFSKKAQWLINRIPLDPQRTLDLRWDMQTSQERYKVTNQKVSARIQAHIKRHSNNANRDDRLPEERQGSVNIGCCGCF